MRIFAYLLIFATIVVPAAVCAGDDTKSPQEGECFNIRKITSWDDIDPQHIYIVGLGTGNRFLLTLRSVCPSLRYAHAIAFSNFTSQFCPGDFGKVTFPGDRGLSSCGIDYVTRVADKDEATALAQAKKDGD